MQAERAKLRVAQQYVSITNKGGLGSEFEALSRSTITDTYEFVPVILTEPHDGVSPIDIRRYRRMFAEADADIVHIRGAGVESLNAVIGAKLARRGKILVTVHGMFGDLVYYSPLKRWICRHIIEPMIFTLSDGISCVCEKTSSRDLFKRYKMKMLPYVYNRMPSYHDADVAERLDIRRSLKLPPDKTIGVYVGRVTKEKGLSYLVDAMHLIKNDLTLVIVGDGEYLPEMKRACADDSRVIFVGQQNNISDYLLSADFFISPSLHENLSISILEACAAHLPCIVTDVGGNPEIIEDGENGIIIPPRSAEAIADAIVQMCDADRRVAIFERAKAVDYTKFSDESVDDRLKAVYSALAAPKRA